MKTPSNADGQRVPARRWKVLGALLLAASGASIFFVAWLFIGGFWMWWGAGFATAVADPSSTINRPLVYSAFTLAFAWLILCAVGGLKTVFSGKKRFSWPAFLVSTAGLIASFTAFVKLGGCSFQREIIEPVVLPGADPSSQIIIYCYIPSRQPRLSLEYKIEGSEDVFRAADCGDGRSRRFRLGGLAPNTTYEYRLVPDKADQRALPAALGLKRYFKTLPAGEAAGFTFLSISDMHGALDPALARRMADERADLIIEAGDLANWGGRSSDWAEYFRTTAPLYGGSSPAAPAPPRAPVMGNHDGAFFGARHFGLYFKGIGAGADSPLWYRFDIGKTHFLMLRLEWGLQSFTRAQEAWLRETLASLDPSDWIIVVTHCPVYSSGNNGEVTGVAARLGPIFAAGGVDLVISGHDHHYQRVIRDGVTYMITATNDPDRWRGRDIPGSQAYTYGRTIYGRYRVSRDAIELAGVCLDGTIADSAVVTK